MKKIISKFMICSATLLTAFSCSREKVSSASNSSNTAEVLRKVMTVRAIGKVTPKDGWASISSDVSARVSAILANEGDSVRKGDVLITLEDYNKAIDIREANEEWRREMAEVQVLEKELQKAHVQAEQLRQEYLTSTKLLAANAETREKVNADLAAFEQQEIALKALEKRIASQSAVEHIQRLRIEKLQQDRDALQVKAAVDGVVTDLSVKVGSNIGIGEELGRIVQADNPIVEAEVDELFASSVREGQQVILFPVGRRDTLALGRVYYGSPVLSDKSILYESANEAEDRRVRRIKIKVEKGAPLIINAKVDCEIEVQ